MKIGYIEKRLDGEEELVLAPENEAEYHQLKNLCQYIGIEWNCMNVSFKVKGLR